MNGIKGLENLVRSAGYRKALGLPGEVTEEYRLLAQGEYNVNYVFTHPVTEKKLLLRVNCGSQMHLDDQIEYEYRALKQLEGSGRTPEVYYCDGSLKYLDHGILVMEYLPGHSLDYRTEIMKAAEILADIHSMPVGKDMIPGEGEERTGRSLISPRDPMGAILDECEAMASRYLSSDIGDQETKDSLMEIIALGWKRKESYDIKGAGGSYRCIINTELNSTNFLINDEGKSYLIDWEKPLYGDPAQDLGHFLAPTTTFWKTDVILTEEEREAFIRRYIEEVKGRFDTAGIKERVIDFTAITCIRGVTWCAMAWVEYREPGRLLTNESTRKKLDQYLDPGFLENIKNILKA